MACYLHGPKCAVLLNSIYELSWGNSSYYLFASSLSLTSLHWIFTGPASVVRNVKILHTGSCPFYFTCTLLYSFLIAQQCSSDSLCLCLQNREAASRPCDLLVSTYIAHSPHTADSVVAETEYCPCYIVYFTLNEIMFSFLFIDNWYPPSRNWMTRSISASHQTDSLFMIRRAYGVVISVFFTFSSDCSLICVFRDICSVFEVPIAACWKLNCFEVGRVPFRR